MITQFCIWSTLAHIYLVFFLLTCLEWLLCLLILKVPSQCGISTALPTELQEIKIDGKNEDYRRLWRETIYHRIICEDHRIHRMNHLLYIKIVTLLPKGFFSTFDSSKLPAFLHYFETLLPFFSHIFWETHFLVHKSIKVWRLSYYCQFSWALGKCWLYSGPGAHFSNSPEIFRAPA